MSKISLTPNAAGTGTFTIAAPGTNTDRTLTLPDGSGTLATTADLAATNVQTFNSSGTWTKPTFGSMARIQVWGGGGGGARNTSTNPASGGGGGGYNEITVPLSTLASTATVTVGAAGVGRTGSAGVGTAGGTTTFGTLLGASGGGGGLLSNSSDPQGGPLSADLTTDVAISGNPFRGGNGTRAASTANNSTYAGAGGAGADTVAYTPGGASFLGGSGGAGSRTATAPSGTAPGGGGGGASADFNGGNGAAGRVVVTVW